MATTFTSPVGRLVGGAPSRIRTVTDARGNPKLISKGPNTGEPVTDCYLALAIEKTNPEVNNFINQLKSAAAEVYPTRVNRADFNYKITDGDSTVPNKNGVTPVSREGYAGCWIFHMGNFNKPACYKYENSELIAIPQENIKTGDYVQINVTVKSNNSDQNPGIFINHNMVLFLAYGADIGYKPDPKDVFKINPEQQLPAGASLTPAAPPVGMAPAPTAPAAPAAPPVGMAPAPAPAAPAPAAPAPTYLLNGQEYTEKQLKDAGWSADAILKLDIVPF